MEVVGWPGAESAAGATGRGTTPHYREVEVRRPREDVEMSADMTGEEEGGVDGNVGARPRQRENNDHRCAGSR